MFTIKWFPTHFRLNKDYSKHQYAPTLEIKQNTTTLFLLHSILYSRKKHILQGAGIDIQEPYFTFLMRVLEENGAVHYW